MKPLRGTAGHYLYYHYGLPCWESSNRREQRARGGAVVVKNMLEILTGFTLDPALLDPEKPLESIARAQLAIPFNPLYGNMIDYFVQAVVKSVQSCQILDSTEAIAPLLGRGLAVAAAWHACCFGPRRPRHAV